MDTATPGMSRGDRRLVIGVAVITAAAMVSGATFNYVVTPLTVDLNATEEQVSLLRQLPSIGALLVMFLVGAWGLRMGARRVMTGCAALTVVGYLIVSAAPVMAVASLGMLVASIGKQGLFVWAFGLLGSRLTSDEDRATGFSVLAAATPFVYVVAPVVATLILTGASWRNVTVLWAVAGILGVIAARRLLPADDPAETIAGELWTPGLAGLGLAAIVQFLNNGSYDGWSNPQTITWLIIAMAAFGALGVAMRRIAAPTLDLSILRLGGFPLLLLVVALVPFTNMWYYATILLQYVYGLDLVRSAVVMVPAQAAGLLGAWLAARWIRQHGIRFTGTAMMLICAFALLLSTLTSLDMSPLYPMVVLSLYSAAWTATGIPLTNAIMNLAPRGGEGDASALRGASASLGAALGVVVMTTVVFTAYQSSLSTNLAEAGQDPEVAAQVSDSLQEGTSSEEVASQLAVPLDTVSDVTASEQQAMVDGYRAHGLVGGVVTLLSAGVFFLNRKGLRDQATA